MKKVLGTRNLKGKKVEEIEFWTNKDKYRAFRVEGYDDILRFNVRKGEWHNNKSHPNSERMKGEIEKAFHLF